MTPTIDSHQDLPLGDDWSLAWTAPGAATDPGGLAALALTWLPARAHVPGTAASALRGLDRDFAAAGGAPIAWPRIDAVDWWYRCRFPGPASSSGGRVMLNLDGLATVADVWLNGQLMLHSENMFVAHVVDVTAHLKAENELVLRFHSLDALLAAKRPRPRWRAPMIEHQQLRWFRTTLLGRTPGWSPPWGAVGPWRPVGLQRRLDCDVEGVRLTATVTGQGNWQDGGDRVGVVGGDGERAHLAGGDRQHGDDRVGVVGVTFVGHGLAEGQIAGPGITDAHLLVSEAWPDGRTWEADATLTPAGGEGWPAGAGAVHVTGNVRIPAVQLWWPHTHGAQPLYQVRVVMTVGGARRTLDLGRVGFRTVLLSTEGDDFSLSINGVPIFCRGVCWTPPDVATLTGSDEASADTMKALRDAGMNMVRVGGPMVYESDSFYDQCDRLGILVWQDFMFANMDYPEEPTFLAGVGVEARQALSRWQGRPCLTLLCGDSEGEQQAAMWGAPPAQWARPLFRELLPAICREVCPDVPYWPSSASGGAFPHQPNVGSTSYYGVGAYLRPLDDARRSQVRFASECLAFANIPEDAAFGSPGGAGPPRAHTPTWKAGVPRDLGAGWDFDDVRDHYLALLFGVDPVTLRSTDPERYLALGRIVTGEVMEAAFAEWRRLRSSCRGALIWFGRDLVAGAGWGILDVTGRPKAAYHYLKRILRPTAVFLSDEGLNGAFVHGVNERNVPWEGQLQLRLYRDGETVVGSGDVAVSIPARGGFELSAAAVLGGFTDTTYAYHFGPPAHDVAVASLISPSGALESETFLFPVGRPSIREADLGMEAAVETGPGGEFVLVVRSRRFAQAVTVAVPDFDSDDNYFHVAPGGTKRIVLRRVGKSERPRGAVQATNARSSTRIVVPPA